MGQSIPSNPVRIQLNIATYLLPGGEFSTLGRREATRQREVASEFQPPIQRINSIKCSEAVRGGPVACYNLAIMHKCWYFGFLPLGYVFLEPFDATPVINMYWANRGRLYCCFWVAHTSCIGYLTSVSKLSGFEWSEKKGAPSSRASHHAV